MKMALDKKLSSLFAIFQDKEKNVVDVQDLPILLRSLGMVPTEAEVTGASQAMRGEESSHGIHLGAFLTGAKKLVLDRRYPGCSKGELAMALQVLAKEGRKHLIQLRNQDPTLENRVPTFGDSVSKPLPSGALSRSVLVSLLSSQGETLSVTESEELIASLPRHEDIQGAVDMDRYATMLLPTSPFL